MKQSIVVRTDLGMGTGKLAAQVAHASLLAYHEADEGVRDDWERGGAKKVVLAADDEGHLLELRDEARVSALPHSLVRDAGHTQVEPDTLTALGVGPAEEDLVDGVTGHLDLL
ncbi:MAG: peptidyl-tRNA hydrolase Pth2 [Halobacteria archaeon]|nr:peptidyl-tRNA hydrolase Pth2 [Halobacteria archaeon]